MPDSLRCIDRINKWHRCWEQVTRTSASELKCWATVKKRATGRKLEKQIAQATRVIDACQENEGKSLAIFENDATPKDQSTGRVEM